MKKSVRDRDLKLKLEECEKIIDKANTTILSLRIVAEEMYAVTQAIAWDWNQSWVNRIWEATNKARDFDRELDEMGWWEEH